MADEEVPKRRWTDDAGLGGKAVVKGSFGLVPGVGSFLTEAMNAVEERKRQREAAVVQATIARLGIRVEELKAKLDSDDELADLWDRAMQAARSSRIKSKQFMCSAIMAGAVYADHNERLTANILIRLLDQLEEEHLQVMVATEKRTTFSRADTKPEHHGADPEELIELLPHLAGPIHIVLSSLLSLNIIHNVWAITYHGLAGNKRYALTPTGEALCRVLRADEPPTDTELLRSLVQLPWPPQEVDSNREVAG
ncbi:hypothetical protein ACIQMJ_11535 [Actinosynnema sp. NPDC091369]